MATAWKMTLASGPTEWPHRLGKKPGRPGAVKFQLSHYLNLDLPRVPTYFRHKDPPPWGDYGNSNFRGGRGVGNCVLAGAANETALWEHEGGKLEGPPPFDAEVVVKDYSALTGFVPGQPGTDEGSDVTAAAEYRRRTGIGDLKGQRHKIDAYAKVNLKNMQHLKAAMYLLGGVGLGFIFPAYAMDQFDARRPWDLRRGWSFPYWFRRLLGDEAPGGHYVPAVGIAPNGNIICISWGREQEMTPAFYLKFADEVMAYLDIDRLKNRVSPEGFDEARLRRDMASVSAGRVYSIPHWESSDD